MKDHSNHIINLNGLLAPVAVLQIVRMFREIKIDERIEMVNCNHEIGKMVLRVLPKPAYHLLDKENMYEKSDLYRVLIQKTGEI